MLKNRGGDDFSMSSNPLNNCKMCKNRKFVGKKSKVLVCIRCDVPPESIGLEGGKKK